MIIWISSIILIIGSSWADVGFITKVKNPSSAYLERQKSKLALKEKMPLDVKDKISSGQSSLLVVLSSGMQIDLSPYSQIVIESIPQNAKEAFQVKYIAGELVINFQSSSGRKIENKINAEGVSFTFKESKFEMFSSGENIEVNVLKGEVEASSPYVQTFVPEIIKAGKGFRFNKRERKFEQRDFKIK